MRSISLSPCIYTLGLIKFNLNILKLEENEIIELLYFYKVKRSFSQKRFNVKFNYI